MSTRKKSPNARRKLAEPKGAAPPASTEPGGPLGRLDPKRRLSAGATVAGFVFVGVSFGLPYLAPEIARSFGNGGLSALRIVGVLLVAAGWWLGRDEKKTRKGA